MDTQKQKIFLADEAATLAIGVKIARYFKPGDIVKITGPLGAGKTTITRGIVQGLGGDPAQVHSPTFALLHEYESPTFLINHCDFYRLAPGSQLEDFGGLEFFDQPNLFIIEWPERIGLFESITPNRLIAVDLQHDSGGRILTIPAFWKID